MGYKSRTQPRARGSVERAWKWWGGAGRGGEIPDPQLEQREPAPYDKSPITQGQPSSRGQRSPPAPPDPRPAAHWLPWNLPSSLVSRVDPS